MKKITLVLLILFSFLVSGYKKPDVHVIDATKNAYLHNNMGLRYMDEKLYYAAIQEFKIAISLNPNTQATAVYYKNIGDAYMQIGYPNLAKQPYEDAIHQYSLNFQYYQKLAQCYKKLGVANSKITEYSKSKNALNKIMLGLLYIENGNTKRGITILDEFTAAEPDLLITPAVKKYVKDNVEQMNKI